MQLRDFVVQIGPHCKCMTPQPRYTRCWWDNNG